MALVKCPECGKENISDSAATCPSCGYGIKEHFERIRQEKAFIEQQRHKQEDLQKELEAELDKIDKTPRPDKPILSEIVTQERGWFVIVLSIPMAILGIVLLVLGCVAGDLGCIIIGAIDTFIFGGVAFTGISNIKERYNSLMSKYQDWDRHKERLKNDTVNRYETRISDLKKQKFEAQKTTTPAENTPIPRSTYGLKCPVCGSTKVKRISNTSRAISVELMGLASSKIAKQYQCKDCKHMW